MSELFLSYARDDDEPFVLKLYERLKGAGRSVWWDRRAMSNRGRTFLQEIRDAIEGAERVIVVVGPSAVQSAHVRAEWEHALRFARGVVPVLRLGDFDLVPDRISDLHCIDFREVRDFDGALAELLRILSEPMVPLGRPLTEIPALPPMFQLRVEDLDRVADYLMADLTRPESLTVERRITALHGMGGIGKSVLAAATVRSSDVRRAFPDGVAWLDCSNDAQFRRGLAGIGDALDAEHRSDYLALETARERLTGALHERACLIVLDDVTDTRYVTPFLNSLSPRSRLLITTRDGSLVTALGANEHVVGLLPDDIARQMLAEWSECPTDDLPADADALLSAVGGLPLAIALCGAMVRDGMAWSDLLDAFGERDLDFAEASLPNYHYATVRHALAVSLSRLSDEDSHAARRYRELAVFRKPRGIPVPAILALWTRDGDMKPRHARKLLTMLQRKALLRPDTETERDVSRRILESLRPTHDDGAAPRGTAVPPTSLKNLIASASTSTSLLPFTRGERVSLHDLQYGYLRSETSEDPTLHGVLLAAYAPLIEQDRVATLADNYYLEHLIDHVTLAGWDDARAALQSLSAEFCSVSLLSHLGGIVAALWKGSADEIREGRYLPDDVRSAWDTTMAFFEGGNHPIGAPAALCWVMQDVQQQRLSSSAENMAFYNELKRRIRGELQRCNALRDGPFVETEVRYFDREPRFSDDGGPDVRIERDASVANVADLDAAILELQERLSEAGDDAQLALIDLQLALQWDQEMMQAWWNSMRSPLREHATNWIRQTQ